MRSIEDLEECLAGGLIFLGSVNHVISPSRDRARWLSGPHRPPAPSFTIKMSTNYATGKREKKDSRGANPSAYFYSPAVAVRGNAGFRPDFLKAHDLHRLYRILTFLGHVRTEKSLDPGVFPIHPRNLQTTAESCRELLHLTDKLGRFRIKISEARLQMIQAGSSRSVLLFCRADQMAYL